MEGLSHHWKSKKFNRFYIILENTSKNANKSSGSSNKNGISESNLLVQRPSQIIGGVESSREVFNEVEVSLERKEGVVDVNNHLSETVNKVTKKMNLFDSLHKVFPLFLSFFD